MSLRFFFQAEDGIRDPLVTGVQTCALPIYPRFCISRAGRASRRRTDDSLVAWERSNARHVTLSSAAKRPCAPADLVDGEAVFAQNDFAWRGRAEALDAQQVTRVADIAVPPLPR